MSQLWNLVQAHLDRWGVTEAALARKMDTRAQTLNSWKNRGVREMPKPHTLAALARATRQNYDHVLTAALHDTGYLPPPSDVVISSPVLFDPADTPTPPEDGPRTGRRHPRRGQS